ncbi:Oidioi.mRNA.OKI2018_I69.XSR.g13365.t1.cds [Oikopleura dioica]|uniref:Oidioi.mRNA.OKI2018_I69.XSR.g13365.t1.cds n=1 Tax=Oikopleura dioica TaxID=34765 RepID=A0ABN7S6M8_OIKDI|nr:Oidioi.mRNA.OKI2018_I69.XSR.g13365.t1.cds [Oikopleura dioica]
MKQQEIGELPTGCSQIIGTNVGCLRKLIWLVFFAGGIIYSTKSIYKNCLVYFEYRSSIKPRFDKVIS